MFCLICCCIVFFFLLQKFEVACQENRQKLDAAAESRGKMEKQTKADSEVDTLNGRWDSVKKVADERVTKVGLVRR